MGIPGKEKPKPGTAGGTPTLFAFEISRSGWPPWPPGPILAEGPSRSGRGKRSCCVRDEIGPRLPPVSVAIRLLIATRTN